MNDRIDAFVSRFNEAIKLGQTLSFITRAAELQEEACHAMTGLCRDAAEIKADVVAGGDEDAANFMLCLECAIGAVLSELKMYLALKRDEPDAAWDLLISAQNAATAAVRAHDSGEVMNPFLARLAAVEHVVFPPQVFSSAGFHIRRAICSLCNDDYAKCGHLKGRPYMGEFCTMIIAEADLQEVSILSNDPNDKRCRVTSFSVKGGKRDRMTWRVSLNNEDSDADAESEAEVESSMRFEAVALRGINSSKPQVG